jgi:hypothetical protein
MLMHTRQHLEKCVPIWLLAKLDNRYPFRVYLRRLKAAIFIVACSFLLSTPSQAQILIGYNTDGSPMYGPEPQGASGPIATPENPTWIPNPDGTPTQAQKDYTFIPNAEENKNKEAKSELTVVAPPGMIQIGYNEDGTPKFGPEPQGASGPIATPENPNWIKNPDGTATAAELNYTFLPNADERALVANESELKKIINEEISTSKFSRIKKSKSYVFKSSAEISAIDPSIKAVAVKKGSKSKNVSLSYDDEGQLVIEASEKLKGYQIQITSGKKVLKKIALL